MDKALDLIEIVAGAESAPRLSELADAAGLHRATAHRVLADLLRRGWVQRDGDRYLPGVAVLRLSRTAATDALVALAGPVLRGLCERTGMMVNLQVLETDRARVVDAVRPGRLAMITDLVGEALPVHRFAGPLALVAALPEAARAPYLRVAEADLHPAEALRADLAAVERDGYALEHGRADSLVASLSRAVPAHPRCALTLVGPDREFGPASLPALLAALTEACDALAGLLEGA
ncbi:IclR family transcriptional regulator [Actinocorallia longicatena]|uniref:IclR family transcriptional regulator n=1 Tax=Actinocorallia longicatena TaxID=111803 RepID=UPI0031D05BA9